MKAIHLLALAGLVGAGVGVWPAIVGPKIGKAGVPISECQVTDGDTIRCGDERIRLLGIDAPEMPGHCRRGRRCVEGDPDASRERLAGGLNGALQIVRVGEDRYGRTLALVSGEQGDLSCRQLASGAAAYRADWDDGGRVAAVCPAVAH